MSTMRAAQYEQGGPDLLRTGEAPVPNLRDGEVLIQIYASAINRADTLQRQGKYPPPPGESDILGLEAVGSIAKLGPKCGKWSVGDRVMALLSGGGNAEYVAAKEDHLMKIPENMNFTTAAAIPEVWLTAYQLLHFVGSLKPSDKVLIHAGGSGVGTAAVQLVKLAQAVCYVTAGSQKKIDVAKGLGAIDGFNYKEANFSQKILDATDGKGVDLVLDCVGSSFWESNAQALAIDGRWVLYGSMGGVNVDGNILGLILRKRISLLGSTLRTRNHQYKKTLIDAFAESALPHFTTGELKPIIEKTFPLNEISSAHKMMEDNRNTGKIIIEIRAEPKNDKEEL